MGTGAGTGSGRGTATEIGAEAEAERGSESRTATATERTGILGTLTACGSGPHGRSTMVECMAGGGMTTGPLSELSPCHQSG